MIQGLAGQAGVETTMVYTQVLNRDMKPLAFGVVLACSFVSRCRGRDQGTSPYRDPENH